MESKSSRNATLEYVEGEAKEYLTSWISSRETRLMDPLDMS